METVKDFEDMLIVLDKHNVQYLVIGGLAFIYHAKPRYTKDIDIWIESSPKNIGRVNTALAEFGSPSLFDADRENQVVQIGVAPNRIDLIRSIQGMAFADAWKNRERGPYGRVQANWIDIDTLIRIKAAINHPRHQHDVDVLQKIRRLRNSKPINE